MAVITGATSGIGRATAIAFAKAGARIVIVDLREKPFDHQASTADVIRQNGGTALFFEADVAEKSQFEILAKLVVQDLGRIDILVNNAGIGQVSLVEHTPDKILKRLWEVNFFGVVYGIQAVVPVMRSQGSGHIISISSGAAIFGLPYAGIYAASKAAIMRFSEALRYELEDSNIQVSVIFPDFTATDLALEVTPDAGMPTRTIRTLNQQGMKQYGPPGVRLQSAAEVARSVLDCALCPRKEVYLSRRIRFHGLFRWLLPWAVEREARLAKRGLRQFLDRVTRNNSKTGGIPENNRITD